MITKNLYEGAFVADKSKNKIFPKTIDKLEMRAIMKLVVKAKYIYTTTNINKKGDLMYG